MNQPERLPDMTADRRRRRPAVSCSLCRKRKIRCNRETPCSNCVRSKNKTCVYETQSDANEPSIRQSPQRAPVSVRPFKTGPRHDTLAPGYSALEERDAVRSQKWQGGASIGSSSSSGNGLFSSASSPAGHNSAWTVDSLKGRMRDLEQQLSDASSACPVQYPHPPTSPVPTEIISNDITGKIHALNRSVMSKTRLFGQTHWINGAILLMDLCQIFNRLKPEGISNAFADLQRCKSLGRAIKAYRSPKSPSQPESIPPREIADKLLDGYLRTIERLFRVFHVPSLKMKYEMLWSSPETADPTFILQLKLVMAIGAAMYDESFSLRASAVRWIHEAEVWLSVPSFKSRLNLPSLQVMILLLLAREIGGVGGDLIWISAGSLLRSAIYMGLHRDPSQLPKMTQFVAEMRRRLWNTIIEVTLQSSVDSGGPPMISLSDFDAEPPGNYDDEQLVESNKSDCSARPPECYSQMSLIIAIRETFPVRLAITKLLNDLRSQEDYAKTIRLDTELRSAYKRLSQTLRTFSDNETSPSQFDLCAVDFIIRRYLLILHIPYMGASLHNTAYAFSRRVAVETSLKLFRAVCPAASAPTFHSTHRPPPLSDFAQLSLCSAGFFRSVPVLACLIMVVELRAQALEDESFGPAEPRPDLLAALCDAKDWFLKRIRAGETNIKGYLNLSPIPEHIDGIVKRLSESELDDKFRRAIEEGVKTCLKILEGIAERHRSADEREGITTPSFDSVSENADGWELYDTMADVQFSFGEVDGFLGSGWLIDNSPPHDLSTW